MDEDDGPEDSLDEELLAMLKEATTKLRPYAPFWDWPDREIAERGVAQELLGGVADQLGGRVVRVKSTGSGNDPPDCIAELDNGTRIGIEVSELVDQAHAGGIPTDWALWTPEKLRTLIASRISRKDKPAHIKGGPFDRYILCLHTAEPMLNEETIRAFVGNVAFGPCRLLDAVWILGAYEPTRGCPTIRLQLTSQDA